MIASQESERKRIAAELHDSLGQLLVVIKNLALMFLQASASASARAKACCVAWSSFNCATRRRQTSDTMPATPRTTEAWLFSFIRDARLFLDKCDRFENVRLLQALHQLQFG